MTFSGTSDEPDPGIQLWSITSDASTRPDKLVDQLGWKPGQNVLYVKLAYNDADGTPNRLKLRDVAVGWYNAKASDSLSNLNSVYLDTVVEPTTGMAMEEIRDRLLGDDRWKQKLTIYADSSDDNQRWAYAKMMSTKFGAGFGKMLDEYTVFKEKGRFIVAFDFGGGVNLMDLRIVFSGV
ncbi:hypothetical protein SLS53_002165 [Cytospora paraplurivora]|uniref:Uncharacterized protein n=1 Tax=Cytospora paraplurivora TaxID=2898453 RepID=A0AAN9UFY9_9PEZI